MARLAGRDHRDGPARRPLTPTLSRWERGPAFPTTSPSARAPGGRRPGVFDSLSLRERAGVRAPRTAIHLGLDPSETFPVSVPDGGNLAFLARGPGAPTSSGVWMTPIPTAELRKNDARR